MSNRPNRRPSRSIPVTGRPAPASGRGGMFFIIGGVAIAIVVAIGVWVVVARGSDEPVLDAQALRGQQVAIDKGCVSCHTRSGDRSEGPTWKGLAGQPVTLTDGSTVIADDAYLTKATRDPGAQVVKDFRPTMPTKPISDAELADLLAYLHALK